MSEQASPEINTTTNPQWWWWLVTVLVIAFLIWVGLTLSRPQPLKPLRQTAVPLNITINGQPLLVDFDALNDNPAEFANKRIRVTGNYLRLAPVDCELFSGPRILWGLIAEGLQLNAKGFEAIVLPMVSPNTRMTLEGIWRRYPGPAGCGKEPPSGLWYLEVEQIVQPNPLVAGTAASGGLLQITPPPFPTATATATGSLPPAGGTPIPEITIVSTVLVNTPIASPTLLGTAVFTTPTLPGTAPISTPTPTAGAGTLTPVPATPTIVFSATPTASATPGNGTAVPTPTNPPLITATPGDGYPAPTTSPMPTSYP